ncbi:MAG: hypothetical protein HZA51_00755 [Planctomycetes bacterium]|nr:hypothetical protein [Planctomycetota bacterium]
MRRIKRTTANLPADLLKDATETTGKGITETLIEGLELVKRSSAYYRLKALQGKIKLKIDLDVSRERTRRR